MLKKFAIVGLTILGLTLPISVEASEATIDQLGGTIRGAIERINTAALTNVPTPTIPGNPLGSPLDVGPGQPVNAALTVQQGNNNLASVTQTGHGNLSQLFQIGNNNAAIVTQTRH